MQTLCNNVNNIIICLLSLLVGWKFWAWPWLNLQNNTPENNNTIIHLLMCSFLANASLNVPADLCHSDVLWLWNTVPVPEWAASDKRLHLDSSSRPPLCTLSLSGDSCRLLHLCSACKSAGQLEWPVGVDPATLNLLLPRLPATVTALITVLLFTPVGAKQWNLFSVALTMS